MGKGWKQHAMAAGLLVGVGLITSLSVLGWGGATRPGSAYWWRWVWLMGTRFFGYGALFMLGAALAIGPLARLWPRRWAWLLAYRRAVGIWSAIGAGVHLLFVLEMVKEYGRTPWIKLFLHQFQGFEAGGGLILRYGFDPSALSAVAWTGLIALGILLVVAAVSSDRAQRLLGQSAWKLTQQGAYAAFLFVVLHVAIMSVGGGKLKGSPPLMAWSRWYLLGVALLQVAGFGYTVWRRR